jgi:acetyl esterase/lipase
MPLDPQLKAHAARLAALGAPPRNTLSPEQVRADMATELAASTDQAVPEPVAQVENRAIAGPEGEIPVRIFTPTGNGPFPLVVYFHSGGWVLGTLDSYDRLCRSIANGARCIVIAVGYRLAPDHKFPAAPEDCFAATRWVAEHASEIDGDNTRMAVVGDSAGGNLAAVVSLMARDRDGPSLVYQAMVYPILDLRMQTLSYIDNADGPMLTREDMIWFRGHYLASDADIVNPLVSPLLASDLSGLPPALLVTAEYDPLRDEGEMYGDRLRQTGVPVTMRRYDGLAHGFMGVDLIVDRARDAKVEIIAALRAVLAAPDQR